jgi:LmbE family N-acetylglucosaminyl deacetylase
MSITTPCARRVALSFMAHPDDAEIVCGGTLIRLAEAGWEVHIVTATPGDCGSMTEDSWAIAHRRTAEARQAAASIGGTYHCLNERDGFVIYDQPTLRKCIDLFRRISPTLVLTHAPRDYMVDHEMASLLARSASFVFAIPNIAPWPAPAGARVPHLYYCDTLDGNDTYGNPTTPTTLLDISTQLEKKTAMLACHASQCDWLRAYHGTDEYLDAMRRHAATRGKLLGVAAAEGFMQHRGHAYPQDDLLHTLFS